MPEYDPLDANADVFRPPAISTIVHCLHCGEEYDSYRMEWRIETDSKGNRHGFWCCPTENCDGRGFGFDIFPVDPQYRGEDGQMMWIEFDDEATEDFIEDEPTSGNPDPNGSGQNDDDQPLPW